MTSLALNPAARRTGPSALSGWGSRHDAGRVGNYFDQHARWVTSVTVNAGGYVTHLWNDDEDKWTSQSAIDVMLDLELAIHSYWVKWQDGVSEIVSGEDAGGRYLYARRGWDDRNALLDLPRHDHLAGHHRAEALKQ